jgi:regulator of sigma E protease
MDLFQILSEWSTAVPGGETLYTVFVFLIVLGILVFVHEWGHFAAAKSVGIKVEEFAIGFGRAIARWTDKHGTVWKIGFIPLGGYVQMKGQEDGKPVTASGEADSYASKTVGQRAWAVVAGPLANFALALVVFIVLMWVGEQKLLPEVGYVQEGMPATGVLQTGDKITAVNDTPVADWETLQSLTSQAANQELNMMVEREGKTFIVRLTPELTTFTDLLGDEHTVGRVGIGPSGAVFSVPHGPVQAVWRGMEKTWEITALTFVSIYKLIIGAVSAEHIAGPLGIADLAGSSAAHGTYHLFMFLAIISINLGIINLLPVPVLDGGHLIFLLIEKIKGAPVGETAQAWSLRFGLGLILLLVVFATHNDLRRLNVFGTEEQTTQQPVK